MSGFNSRSTNASTPNSSNKRASFQKAGNGANATRSSLTSSACPLRQSSSSMRRQSRKPENDTSYEEVLHHTLVQMAQIVLKANAQRTVHDVTSFSGHLQGRAEQMVNEEISNVMNAAMEVTGSQTGNKIAAYSYVTTALLRDLERVSVAGDHKIQLSQLRDSNQLLRNESSRVQAQLTQDVAHRDQKIRDMETEISILHYKNQSLLKTVELLSSELQRCNRTLTESQENYLNLCLKSLELKGEVDDCCDSVLSSINSRIGFIPNSVFKSIAALKDLKPPGDPSVEVLRKYNKKRSRKSKIFTPPREMDKVYETFSDAIVDNENMPPMNNGSFHLDVRANGLVSASIDKSIDSISLNHSTTASLLTNHGSSSEKQVEGENVASTEENLLNESQDKGAAAYSALLNSYTMSR